MTGCLTIACWTRASACSRCQPRVAVTAAAMQAYRVACHMSDTKAQEQETIEIQNSHVFNRLIFFMLNEVRGPAAPCQCGCSMHARAHSAGTWQAHDLFCKLLDLDPRVATSSLAGLQKRSR